MLNTAPTTPATIQLDITLGNWVPYYQQLKLACQTGYGTAGAQILFDRIIPLHPFPVAPTKFDLDCHEDGTPIPHQYTYGRRARTPEDEAAAAIPAVTARAATANNEARPASDAVQERLAIPTASLPLSDRGSSELRADQKIFMETSIKANDHDVALHKLMCDTMSLPSHLTVRTHVQYPPYTELPIGSKSFALFQMMRATHAIGNASVKMSRTRDFFQSTQGSDSHAAFLDKVNTRTDTFSLDYSSMQHPGFVSINEICSSIYLSGLNKEIFRRPLDNLLESTPDGRFPDPIALQRQMHSWLTANTLSIPTDDPSAQGSAYLATKSTPPPRTKKPNAKPATPKAPYLHPIHCSWCLAVDKVSRYGHLAAYCSKNPNRLPGTCPPPATTTPHQPQSSSRLHALLSQLDAAPSAEASNAAMLLIAEAAIESADFPDSA